MSSHAGPSERGRWGPRFREILLTTGAVLGVLCLGWAITMSLFAITPLVLTSGSMAPEIATGDLALARSLPAVELRRGDVVSVVGESGVRVTHRIVTIERSHNRAVLTLKGDANASPDTGTYAVTDADRVFTHVPKAGYVVSAIASPTGVFAGSLLVAAALLAAFGPGTARPRGGRRRADVIAAGLVLTALGAGSQIPPVQTTQAAFTDNPSLTTGSFAAHTLQPPNNATCSSGVDSATITWANDVRYDYEVLLRRQSTSAVESTRQITGSSASTTYSTLAGHFGSTAGTMLFQVEIRSKLATATSWQSATVRTYNNIHISSDDTVSCT